MIENDMSKKFNEIESEIANAETDFRNHWCSLEEYNFLKNNKGEPTFNTFIDQYRTVKTVNIDNSLRNKEISSEEHQLLLQDLQKKLNKMKIEFKGIPINNPEIYYTFNEFNIKKNELQKEETKVLEALNNTKKQTLWHKLKAKISNLFKGRAQEYQPKTTRR